MYDKTTVDKIVSIIHESATRWRKVREEHGKRVSVRIYPHPFRKEDPMIYYKGESLSTIATELTDELGQCEQRIKDEVVTNLLSKDDEQDRKSLSQISDLRNYLKKDFPDEYGLSSEEQGPIRLAMAILRNYRTKGKKKVGA